MECHHFLGVSMGCLTLQILSTDSYEELYKDLRGIFRRTHTFKGVTWVSDTPEIPKGWFFNFSVYYKLIGALSDRDSEIIFNLGGGGKGCHQQTTTLCPITQNSILSSDFGHFVLKKPMPSKKLNVLKYIFHQN